MHELRAKKIQNLDQDRCNIPYVQLRMQNRQGNMCAHVWLLVYTYMYHELGSVEHGGNVVHQGIMSKIDM